MRLYRGQAPVDRYGGGAMLAEHFPDGRYVDVPGLCSVTPTREVLARGGVLSPGRYVGYRLEQLDDEGFALELAALRTELASLDEASDALAREIRAQLDTLAGEGS